MASEQNTDTEMYHILCQLHAAIKQACQSSCSIPCLNPCTEQCDRIVFEDSNLYPEQDIDTYESVDKFMHSESGN